MFGPGGIELVKCVCCGRTRQGANVCRPCRQASNRLLGNGFTAKETFLVMMFSKIIKKQSRMRD